MNWPAWVRASRLPSQSYIFFPLLFGQGLSTLSGHDLDPWLCLLTHLYGLCIQLFIVYANDYADVEVDRRNTTFTLFSGGSRVLVEGMISRPAMARAIGTAMAANLVVAGALWVQQRPLFLPMLVLSWALLWMYSYAPVRLSYRGGGEILQALGVGGLLPVIGYYNQAGSLQGFPWQTALFILPLQLGAAMATSIPDEPSDREGGKHTASVVLGTLGVKIAVLVLLSAAITALAAFPRLDWTPQARWCAALLPGVLVLAAAGQARNAPPGSPRANRFVTLVVAAVVCFMAGVTVLTLL